MTLWSLLRALFSVVRSIACTRVIRLRCPGSCAPLRLSCNSPRVVRRVSDSKENLCRLAIFGLNLFSYGLQVYEKLHKRVKNTLAICTGLVGW